MLDAVTEAARLLESESPSHRRVILLISESKDRGSKAHIADVLALLERKNILVCTLTFSAYITPFTAKPEDLPQSSAAGVDFMAIFSEIGRSAKRSTAAALAGATGGARFDFARQRGLETALQRIALDLHSQYILSFSPKGEEPGFHKLQVQVLSHPEAQVRTRPGYWMNASP
jgi:VWFA-related protein